MRTSITAHGGAVRYWKHRPSGKRAVLCEDGKILEMWRGRWMDRGLQPEMMHEQGWEPETGVRLSAAVTRTTRGARRLG